MPHTDAELEAIPSLTGPYARLHRVEKRRADPPQRARRSQPPGSARGFPEPPRGLVAELGYPLELGSGLSGFDRMIGTDLSAFDDLRRPPAFHLSPIASPAHDQAQRLIGRVRLGLDRVELPPAERVARGLTLRSSCAMLNHADQGFDHRPKTRPLTRCKSLIAHASGNASARAAVQPPYTSLTVLAGGHSAPCSRASASGPRLLACERDQSYEDGGLP
jgi:hypothetical protein